MYKCYKQISYHYFIIKSFLLLNLKTLNKIKVSNDIIYYKLICLFLLITITLSI